LVENAIDAQATCIQVHIKQAGKTRIQVIDNGKGMNAHDAQKCFLRHATSKIQSADDLFSLTTKGFRGEALASIAAIAHVSMQTRETQASTGTKIIIEGSQIVSTEETVCATGTNFEVKNLFYNVPARRNFLKSDEVEFRHIKDEFERIALAHPNLGFVLTHNTTTLYDLRESVLRKRIVDIIGERQNDRLVPINEQTDIVAINGYVIKPEYAKKARGEQFFFVNQRFFKDSYFHHAVSKAFDGLIQPKTFPGYFLYFEIDPAKIDVNVHPTKTEIKFEENQFVYSILVSAIRQALGKYNIAPTLDFDRETSFDLPLHVYSQPLVSPQITVRENYNPFVATNGKQSFSAHHTTVQHSHSRSREEWENFYAVNTAILPKTSDVFSIDESVADDTVPFVPSAEHFLVHEPYLFFSSPKGVMIIHGHRAYERIVYDAMIREFVVRPIASQALLFPYEKEVSGAEQIAWQANYSLLQRLGFASTIDSGMLFLSAVPSVLQEDVIGQCLDAILETCAFEEVDKGDIAHILVARIAKNAGRFRQLSTRRESVQHLIDSLFESSEHLYTPSGKLIIKTVPISSNHPLF